MHDSTCPWCLKANHMPGVSHSLVVSVTWLPVIFTYLYSCPYRISFFLSRNWSLILTEYRCDAKKLCCGVTKDSIIETLERFVRDLLWLPRFQGKSESMSQRVETVVSPMVFTETTYLGSITSHVSESPWNLHHLPSPDGRIGGGTTSWEALASMSLLNHFVHSRHIAGLAVAFARH